MAISNVKSALYTDLQTLTTANGYSTTIKTFSKMLKLPNEVDVTKCPLLCFELVECPQKPFDEANNSFDLRYWIVIHVALSGADLDETGDVIDALTNIYEDLVALFNKQTTTTYKLDEVENTIIENLFPVVMNETRGWAIIPLLIKYK